jgi:hypothetical protein
VDTDKHNHRQGQAGSRQTAGQPPGEGGPHLHAHGCRCLYGHLRQLGNARAQGARQVPGRLHHLQPVQGADRLPETLDIRRAGRALPQMALQLAPFSFGKRSFQKVGKLCLVLFAAHLTILGTCGP